MSFDYFQWQDRDVEHPNRIKLTNVNNGSELGTFDVVRDEGNIIHIGTKLNSDNMNGLENRIGKMFNSEEFIPTLNNLNGENPKYEIIETAVSEYNRIDSLVFISINIRANIQENNGSNAILKNILAPFPKRNNSDLSRYILSKVNFNICGVKDGQIAVETNSTETYISLFNNDYSKRLEWNRNNPEVNICASGVYITNF